MRSFPARRAIVPAAVMAVIAVLLVQRASAAPTCIFDGPSGAMTVTLGPNESTTISRQVDTIAVDGVPCAIATVLNTDTITVTGTGSGNQLTIDLSGGAFAPGRTPEADLADSEIEWTDDLGQNGMVHVLGGSGVDAITVGGGGINLNAGEAIGDADVSLMNTPVIDLDGSGSDDTLSAAGGQGTGGAVGGLGLRGSDGADTLIEGSGGDQVDGGAGTDTMDFAGSTKVDIAAMVAGIATVNGAATTQFVSVENVTGSPGDDHIVGDGNANTIRGADGKDVIDGGVGDDALFGGQGNDTVDYGAASQGVVVDLAAGTGIGDGTDTLSEFENVTGSAFGDTIEGDGGPNVIAAGNGDDLVDGLPGDDQLDGGPGGDTVDFGNSTQGVTVDLKAGTATGAGTDVVTAFENANGSRFKDDISGDDGRNVLNGRGRGDKIFARAGNDVGKGGRGQDLLYGGKGGDHLYGEAGKDQILGGSGNDVCSGGPDPDAWVDCEQ